MNVLVFAPHPDDEILGCGGTMAKHIANGDNVYVCVVTTGKKPFFNEEVLAIVKKTREGQKKAHQLIGIKETIYLDFPAAAIESVPRIEFNNSIRKVVLRTNPEVVYVPHYGDMQKDHELVFESVLVAVRPRGDIFVKNVYSYETLSETEWNAPYSHKAFMPQRYVDISSFIDIKIKALGFFEAQLSPFPAARSLEAVDSLAKFRGSTIHALAAEAFMVIREID